MSRSHAWAPVRRKGKPTGVFKCERCGTKMRELVGASGRGGALVRVYDWPVHLTPLAIGSYEAPPAPFLGWTTVRPKCEAAAGG